MKAYPAHNGSNQTQKCLFSSEPNGSNTFVDIITSHAKKTSVFFIVENPTQISSDGKNHLNGMRRVFKYAVLQTGEVPAIFFRHDLLHGNSHFPV